MILTIEDYKNDVTTLLEVNNVILDRKENTITVIGIETKTLDLNEFDKVEVIDDGRILLSYKCMSKEEIKNIKQKLNENKE